LKNAKGELGNVHLQAQIGLMRDFEAFFAPASPPNPANIRLVASKIHAIAY
jgi:hypothetical protein